MNLYRPTASYRDIFDHRFTEASMKDLALLSKGCDWCVDAILKNYRKKANLKKKLELRRDFFGGSENGIMLPHKRGDIVIHSNHGEYTEKIREHMKDKEIELKNTGDYDDDELLADALFKEAEKIAKGIREELIEQCLLGNKNVNEVLDNYTF